MASAASEAAVAAATAACSANLFRSEHGVVPNEEEKENDSDSNRNKAEIISQLLKSNHWSSVISSATSGHNSPTSGSIGMPSSVSCQQNNSEIISSNGHDQTSLNTSDPDHTNGCQQNGTSNTNQDYMGLALKQWSVYLGNVLLNFIHKECKNGNVCSATSNSRESQQLNNFMNHQIKSQHAQNSNSVNGNQHRTNSSSSIVTSTNSGTGSYGSISCHQHSHQQYCPSCHYHNQLQHLMSPPTSLPSSPQAYYHNGYANFFTNANYNVRAFV